MTKEIIDGVLPATGFVRLATILKVFPVSRSHWYAGIQAGRYPAPTKLSERISAWKVEQIRALLDNSSK